MEAQKANMDAAFSHLKRFIGILFLFIGLTLQGQTVDGEKALEIARKFANSNIESNPNEKSANTLKLIKSEKFTLNTEDNLKSGFVLPAFHVINIGTNNGFVIVAGDERSTPILGYSDKGSFKEGKLPEQFDALLNFYKKEIEEVVSTDIEMSIEPNASWDELKYGNTKSASTNTSFSLISTEWDQDKYYNTNFPEDSRVRSSFDGHVPVGCVSVALSQMMHYWEWPKTGEGEYCYTSSGSGNYGEQCANFERAFDYPNMPNQLSSSSTANQKNNVSQFLYDVAVACKTTFKYNGSSASSSRAKRAMVEHFNYSSKSKLVYKSQYNDTEWVTLLKSHLDNEIPVYYRGDNNGAFGHAWVCDGYDDQNNFHFNWGWGGDYNGFFALDAVKPTSNYNLTFHQGIIMDMFPNNEDFTINNMLVDNVYVSPDSSVKVSFTQEYKGYDYSECEISFSYYLSEDETPDNQDLLLGVEKNVFSKSKNAYNKNEVFEIPANIAYGTYYIILVADSKNNCKENNEDNNIAITKISVSEPVVNDFLVSEASIENEELRSGDDLVLTCKQVYDGNANMEVDLKSGYYLSEDANLDIADILLGEEESSLSSTNNYEVESQKVRIPVETPAGNYFILFVSDHFDEYKETKEDNNISFFEISVSECEDFFEPNNTKEDAYSLGNLISFVDDKLCIQEKDEDWFSFNVNSDTYYLKVDNLDASLTGNYGVEITDDNGVLFIETFKITNNTDTRISLYDDKFNLIASDDDGGEDKYSKLTFNYLLAGPLDIYNSNGLNVYPNPTRGILNIDTNLKEISEEIIVTILDTKGSVLKQTEFNHYNDVDLTNFPNGEYIIALSSDTGLRQTKKVIKN